MLYRSKYSAEERFGNRDAGVERSVVVMAVINREEVLGRLGDDEELYAEICGLFQRDGRMMLTRLQNELSDGTLEMATRYVQSIKSMAANIGADELTELARQAEEAGRSGDASVLRGYLPHLETQLNRVLQELSRHYS